MKILIIDPNQTRRNQNRTRFSMQDFEVELATSGMHALHLAENNDDYHLGLIYSDMKDMSACEIILNFKENFRLPLIFVPEQEASADELKQAKEFGVDIVIPPNQNFQHLVSQIKKLAK